MTTTLTMEVTAFTFAELSDAAKYSVYVNQGYHEDHFEQVKEMWDYWLDEIGLSCLSDDLRYSVSFCQGDGVGFKGNFDLSDVTDPNFDRVLQMLWTRTEGTGRFSFADPALDGHVTVHAASHNSWPGGFSVDVEVELPEGNDSWTDFYDDYDGPIAKAVKSYLDDVARWLYRYAHDEILRSEEWLTERFTEIDTDALFDEQGDRLN